jgi:hypothetical protein
MKETMLVDAEVYRWLGAVIRQMDDLSMNNKSVGKLTWEASNAYDALTADLEPPRVVVDGSTRV